MFRDEELGRILYGLKNFGIRDPETVDCVGANAKMNEFCAAMGICNLRHIDEEIRKRGNVVERYRSRLKEAEGITLPAEQAGVVPNYAYFPVFLRKNSLAEAGMKFLHYWHHMGLLAENIFIH